MPCKCNTSEDLWSSDINGDFEGKIAVNQEDGEGNFDGFHYGRIQSIKGKCTPAGMWFHVPAQQPEFVYVGKFTTADCKRVEGKRKKVGNFLPEEFDAALIEEDWVATKPVTFAPTDANTATRETPASKPAEKNPSS
jgi:hypothetical protein